MWQNSVQILQHDKVKLNDDLQNACKESGVLGGKISATKKERLQPQEENTSLEDQVASSQVENDPLQIHVPAKRGTTQKLENLVSSSEQGRTHLNSEVGTLTIHIQSRLLQIIAREDVKEKTEKASGIGQPNYNSKKPHAAQEFAVKKTLSILGVKRQPDQ